jgi:hypothetical protein
MKIAFMIVVTLAVILAIREICIAIKRSVKAYRLKKIRACMWNSFTGYESEKDQVNKTLDRR